MYRQRRRSPRRRRCATAVTVFAAVLTYATLAPTLSSASPVDDLLNQVGLGGAGGGAAPAEPKAGVPPTYTPPMHGTNPHGQGSVATLDIEPSNTNPYPGEPTEEGCSDAPADCEEVIIGDSRGEEGSSGYNGRVTLLYLFGNPIVQVTSSPGESNDGPLQDLQDGADQLCTESDENICLTLLGMHSSSTSNSSTNSFTAAGLQLGGEGGLTAEAASSHGNISEDDKCQTAHGDSSLASVGAGGQEIVGLMQGSSTSTACNDGSESVQNDSAVLILGGERVPFPSEECADGTPNTEFTDASPLFAFVCNADDTNGSQADSPYGVREAFTFFLGLMEEENTAFLKATGAGPESHAEAPPRPTTTTPTPPAGGTQGGQGGGAQGGDEGGRDAGGGGGAVAEEAAAGGDQLAFTGSDLLVLGLIGGTLILAGIALTSAGRQRESI